MGVFLHPHLGSDTPKTVCVTTIVRYSPKLSRAILSQPSCLQAVQDGKLGVKRVLPVQKKELLLAKGAIDLDATEEDTGEESDNFKEHPGALGEGFNLDRSTKVGTSIVVSAAPDRPTTCRDWPGPHHGGEGLVHQLHESSERCVVWLGIIRHVIISVRIIFN